MQAFNPAGLPVGEPVEVPDNLPDFNHQAEQLMKQPGADKIKIFIPVEQLKAMSPTQRLLFELKNKAKIAVSKEAPVLQTTRQSPPSPDFPDLKGLTDNDIPNRVVE